MRVSDIKSLLRPDRDFASIAVERAISEIRSGRPVLIRAGRSLAIAVGVEGLDDGAAYLLESLARGRARLALTAPRLKKLGFDRSGPGVIALPLIDVKRIQTLAMDIGARYDAPAAHLSKLDKAAMELVRLSLVAPAVIVVPVAAKSIAGTMLATVDASAIETYRAHQVTELSIVSRAPVPLEGAPETEFVVFRGGEGLRDQVAVIIGRPDLSKPVAVRLHSACLTGDLFGSLKCDCGDQLRYTARAMAENGGGILLYLDQEGRGNGFSNKMKAYHLQAHGFDTYDADEALGFGHDQRRFDFAADMLKQLGIKSVRIMTNNPVKIAALEEAGLEVAADERIIGRMNDHNVRYLTSKRDRAGHLIDADQLTTQPTVHGVSKD
ncbi:MAG: GTP cyclohydrolase II RibA [Rhizobiales bacterium]|nr:GTP cyclohydrolase II RibA [Hyphomicrobiales bacterium]